MPEKSPIPGYALLMAAAMRAIDLQDTQADASSVTVAPPRASDGAAQRADQLNSVLIALERMGTEGDSGHAAIELLWERVHRMGSPASLEEVRFVCRFMSTDRECHYVDPIDGLAKSTRNWTRLLNYDHRRDRVRLTEAGRFFLRLGSVSHTWLYEDKQAAKIVSALRLGQFDDAIQFAAEHIRALRQISEDLNRLIEAPTVDHMMGSYFEHRESIEQMLLEALKQVQLAKLELDATATQERLLAYQEARPDSGISLQRLRGVLALAHQAMESANRTWATFLGALQDGERHHLGVVDFGRVLTQMVVAPPSRERLANLLEACVGWRSSSYFASVLEIQNVLAPIQEQVDFAPLIFDSSDADGDGNAVLYWLDRNADILKVLLAAGPQPLSRLLEQPDVTALQLSTISDVAAVFATFCVPEPFGTSLGISLELSPGLVTGETNGYSWSVPDLSLSAKCPEQV